MTNRRQFLQIGISASAVSLLPVQAMASAGSLPAWPRVYRILQDARFPASASLARSLQGMFDGKPASMVTLEGDITRFWRQDLSRAWQQSPQPIAGVTGASVLFCLEQLARDHRLRVQWQQEVATTSNEPAEPLVAWVIAPA